MTVTETVRTEIFNLKKTEIISIAVFILTFLVKINISLLIVSSLFLLQTVQFRALFKTHFFFVLWIKIPHLIVISSDLLIQSEFHCRFLLTINNYCCSLHKKNTNLNLYYEPYQNWAEQSYNQWNKDEYRSNYSQQFKIYYSEITDQYNQFKNYKNNYYQNGRFE